MTASFLNDFKISDIDQLILTLIFSFGVIFGLKNWMQSSLMLNKFSLSVPKKCMENTVENIYASIVKLCGLTSSRISACLLCNNVATASARYFPTRYLLTAHSNRRRAMASSVADALNKII